MLRAAQEPGAGAEQGGGEGFSQLSADLGDFSSLTKQIPYTSQARAGVLAPRKPLPGAGAFLGPGLYEGRWDPIRNPGPE